MGENIHGVYVRWEDQVSRLNDDPVREDNALQEKDHIGFREDSVTVDNCKIMNFSGDGIHLERIWAFTVKDSILGCNQGSGISIKGWDGWITNCIMYSNRGAGIYADDICAAVTMTGNRIEWNRMGGDYKMRFDWQRFFMGTKFAIFNYATQEAGGHVDVDFFSYEKINN